MALMMTNPTPRDGRFDNLLSFNWMNQWVVFTDIHAIPLLLLKEKRW